MMVAKNFKKEDYNYDSFTFRLTGLVNPYKHWFYIGKYGYPKHMQRGNPFTPGDFYWAAKWMLILGTPFFFLFCYSLIVSLMVKDSEEIWKALGGLAISGGGIWLAYNIRHGLRDGLAAKLAEEEQAVQPVREMATKAATDGRGIEAASLRPGVGLLILALAALAGVLIANLW